jgi:hypothetical protein
MTGLMLRMGDSKGAYKNLLGRPEGKRPLGRPRRGWEDNIKMDLQEVGCGAMGLIDLAQGRAGGGLL